MSKTNKKKVTDKARKQKYNKVHMAENIYKNSWQNKMRQINQGENGKNRMEIPIELFLKLQKTHNKKKNNLQDSDEGWSFIIVQKHYKSLFVFITTLRKGKVNLQALRRYQIKGSENINRLDYNPFGTPVRQVKLYKLKE